MPVDPAAHLTVSVLYPTLLNIYADRGNLIFLQRRCEWRNIGFSITSVGIGDPIDADGTDLIYVGGGQDRDQALCSSDREGAKAELLRDWVSSGSPMLAVCGGYQMLGHGYRSPSVSIDGVGAFDAETVAGRDRLIGAIEIKTDLPGPTGGVLAGFENHSGRTTLGPAVTALGRVVHGHGNDGVSGMEGVRQNASIGTYLHGPLLPKNWWLADWLIASALGISVDDLPSLPNEAEVAAHRSARKAAGS